MSFKNPLTPLITDPVNIDIPIQSMQQALAGLGWIEKSFGRAFTAQKKNAKGDLVYYPQVWQGLGKDLLEVLPNDNLKSQSFFKVEEPIETVRMSTSGGWSTMRAKVSLIVWFNFQRIDPGKTFDYPHIEVLKGSVRRLLTNHSFPDSSTIKILREWETAKNVYAGYNIYDVRDQELVYPWGGFRFELELNYLESCPDTVFEVP